MPKAWSPLAPLAFRLCQLGHPWLHSPLVLVGCLFSQETPMRAKALFLPHCLFPRHSVPAPLILIRALIPAHDTWGLQQSKSAFHFTCGSYQ